MDCKRHRVNPLFVALLPGTLALAWLTVAPGRVGWSSEVLQGIGAEVLRGTTEGRQAMVGSCWYGLLPPLAVTPLVRLLGDGVRPWSAMLLGATAFALLLLLTWRGIRRSLSAGLALPIGLALLVAPMTLRLAGEAPAAIGALACVWVLVALADWAHSPRLRFLLSAAAGMAAAALSPVDGFGWLVTMALALLLGMTFRRETRRRWSGASMLALLPMLYAMGVWLLLNWLVLGDALFFVRGILTPERWEWLGWRRPAFGPGHRMGAVLSGVALARGLWRRDGRAAMVGFGGISAWVWLWVMSSLGMSWAGVGLETVMIVAGALSAANMVGWISGRQPRLARIMACVPLLAMMAHFVWLGMKMPETFSDGDFLAGTLADDVQIALSEQDDTARDTAWDAADAAEAVLDEVERFVLGKTAHGRVFVTGFDALGLLWRDSSRQLFQPVLDLHLDQLRRAYWGLDLYLLVRRPVERGGMDDIHVRHPGLYSRGAAGLLYVADWDEWRLFEVVGTPSRRLDRWRRESF